MNKRRLVVMSKSYHTRKAAEAFATLVIDDVINITKGDGWWIVFYKDFKETNK